MLDPTPVLDRCTVSPILDALDAALPDEQGTARGAGSLHADGGPVARRRSGAVSVALLLLFPWLRW